MLALDRKLLRDLAGLRGQVTAICLVIACGVATFVLSLSTLDSLRRALEAAYDRGRFAHVFAPVKRAPESLAARVAEIPGVAAVETRIVAEVALDVPGLAEPAVGRLVSLPEPGGPGLNALHLRTGRTPEPGRAGEVVANEAFAAAHRFAPGSRLAAVLNGRRADLTVVGVGLSPEFVYQIRPGELLPDDLRFGVLWMARSELEAALDLAGAFNEVDVRLAPGASEAAVLERLDALLAPYGGLGAYGRADQTSHRYVSDELTQLRAMALVTPSIFLGVAAFLVQVVLARLVGAQRDQIAALKAFGYSDAEVAMHYLLFAVTIVAAGGALGVGAGALLGADLTQLYGRFFRFPSTEYRLDPSIAGIALLVSAAAVVAGALGTVRRVARLPPAEALRAESPATYGSSALERIGLGAALPLAARMVVRNLERRPLTTALSVLGVALAASISVLGAFVEDVIDVVIAHQFERVQRQDVTVAFFEPTSSRALDVLRSYPGVRSAEPVRSVPVRLRRGARSRRLAILGIEPGSRLFRPLDERGRPVDLPADGVVMSEKLAELLGAGPGDDVVAEVLEGERPARAVRVAGLVSDFSGTNCYMDLAAVRRLLREQDAVTGAFLAVDRDREQALYAELRASPRVGSVTVKRAAIESFRRTLAENLLRMKLVNVVFAGIIGFGVVYNAARIVLAERARELASLRVLGFTRAEISSVLLGELAAITLPAVPLGLAIGRWMCEAAMGAMETETQRFPFAIGAATYGFAAAVTLVAALVSALVVRRRLDRLDLVAVLKARE